MKLTRSAGPWDLPSAGPGCPPQMSSGRFAWLSGLSRALTHLAERPFLSTLGHNSATEHMLEMQRPHRREQAPVLEHSALAAMALRSPVLSGVGVPGYFSSCRLSQSAGLPVTHLLTLLKRNACRPGPYTTSGQTLGNIWEKKTQQIKPCLTP